jgi:uncharacterized phage protein (TIGR02218 family)
MRSIPAALQTRLDGGVTTLAQAWKLTRRDGVVMGFTDHDRDLVVDGVLYRAGTGLAASEASQRFDLAVDGGEIAGAFDDAVLTDADLAAGRYDAAAVETWLVDWSDASLRLLTARATLGEIGRQGAAFVAELRGPADALAQDSGRYYTARCNADLGDGKCRADLGNPAWRGSGMVTALRGVSQFEADGLGGFADGWFGAGRLLWTGGANTGLAWRSSSTGLRPAASCSHCGRRCPSRSRPVTRSASPPAATRRWRPAATGSPTATIFAAFRISRAMISS